MNMRDEFVEIRYQGPFSHYSSAPLCYNGTVRNIAVEQQPKNFENIKTLDATYNTNHIGKKFTNPCRQM